MRILLLLFFISFEGRFFRHRCLLNDFDGLIVALLIVRLFLDSLINYQRIRCLARCRRIRVFYHFDLSFLICQLCRPHFSLEF